MPQTPPPPPARKSGLKLPLLLIFAVPFGLLLLAEMSRRTGFYSDIAPKAAVLLEQPQPMPLLSNASARVWRLAIPLGAQCDQACVADLRQLHGFRIALGRRSDRLRLSVVHTGLNSDRQSQLQREFSGLSLHSIAPGTPVLPQQGQWAFGLVDPAGYLIALFPVGTEPKEALSDIRRLIR